MSDKYILNSKDEPEPCDDLFLWAQWLENSTNRTVALDETPNGTVSTVFLGLDHSFGQGPPVLWETIVFDGPLDGEQERYTSKEAALTGHHNMLCRVKTS